MPRNCQDLDTAYAVAVAQIERADLPAPVYRTARRLLDLAAAHAGDIIVDREEACRLCGNAADGTMRSHLIQLARTGVIAYHTNHYVSVRFTAWQRGDEEPCGEPGDNSPPDFDPRDQRSDTRAERAQTAPPPRAERSPTRDQRSHNSGRALSARRRAVGDQIRALGDQNDPPIGCLFDQSTPLHEGDQTNKHAAPVAPPHSPETARAMELLIDVGVAGHMARQLAARVPLAEVIRHIAFWLPAHEAGDVKPGLLVSRLKNREPAPAPTPVFFRSEWYRRHFPDASPPDEARDDEQRRRRAYLPDDLSDLMVG